MFDYVTLLVEYFIMSLLIFPTRIVTTYSSQGIPNLLVVVVIVVYYIYIYILYIYTHGYNSFVILYNDGVVFVWMIEYRVPIPDLSIECRVSSYLQRIMTTRSFTVAVHLLVVVLIGDWRLLYVYVHISTIC